MAKPPPRKATKRPARPTKPARASGTTGKGARKGQGAKRPSTASKAKPASKPRRRSRAKAKVVKLAPGPFGIDFEKLEDELVRASRKAIVEVAREHRADQICGFALVSDDGAMTVGPAFDLASARAERLEAEPDHAGDALFPTGEWALEGAGAEAAFERICAKVRKAVAACVSFGAFKVALIETCLRALERVRDGGALRKSPACLLRFEISDGEIEARTELLRMRRLMPSSPYLAQLRSWLRAR